MPRLLKREPQQFTVDEYFSPDTDLPETMELCDDEIGPLSDAAKLAGLANLGDVAIVRLTGPEVWHEALRAIDR